MTAAEATRHERPTTGTEVAVVVSHTHWDRAWHLPFQRYRLELVKTIDGLLDALAADPDYRCFLLDGQMAHFDDYVEVRPERRGELEAFCRAGRIQGGPWYLMADEYLVSPEALVRNLKLGLDLCDAYGIPPQGGYDPDVFGHPAQLPMILQGFGLDTLYFWRGMGAEAEELGNTFWWRAPDGSRVLATWLDAGYGDVAQAGYPFHWGNNDGLPYDEEGALAVYRAAIDGHRRFDRTGVHLLLAGIDHAPIQRELPDLVAAANKRFPDVRFELADLPTFRKRAMAAASEHELPEHRGDLRSGRFDPVLQSTTSTRMYLKLANAASQTLLERRAEPLTVFGALLGGTDARSLLRSAWTNLIRNHPHDEICGCSVDLVHDQMMARFVDVDLVATDIARDGFETLAGAITPPDAATATLIVFNPLGQVRAGVATTVIELEADDPAVGGFDLIDVAGAVVPIQLGAWREQDRLDLLRHRRVAAVSLTMPMLDIPACGYRAFSIRPQEGRPGSPVSPAAGAARVRDDGPGLENDLIRLTISVDGSCDLLDKETGRIFAGLHVFEDTEDAGDEYTWAPASGGQTITTAGGTATVETLSAGPVLASVRVAIELPVPVSLTGDRSRRSGEVTTVRIVSELSIGVGERFVRVETSIDNTARDHRLRLLAPTGLTTGRAVTAAPFGLTKRPVAPRSGTEDWVEPPLPTHPMRHFVGVTDGDGGLAVLSGGLTEYEATPGEDGVTLALTLLRSVGWMSQAPLPTRSSHGGLHLPTPGAQCLGRTTIRYALMPHDGDWIAVHAAAEAFAAPPLIAVRPEPLDPERFNRRHSGLRGTLPADFVAPAPTLPSSAALITVEPPSLLLSAVKPADGSAGDDQSFVVRLVNLGDEPVEALIRSYLPLATAAEVRLSEAWLHDLPLADEARSVGLTIGPASVSSVRLTPAST